jgi:rRNA maturation RNase YbeY
MPVEVTSRRRARGLRATDVRRDAEWLLHALGADGELSVALVGDEAIRGLNARYRRIDRSTDVLAFAQREGEDPTLGGPLLGDVVISIDTAARQARGKQTTLAEEVRVLLAHGILHLLGYDHERSPAEARRMCGAPRRVGRGLSAKAPRPTGRRSRARRA